MVGNGKTYKLLLFGQNKVLNNAHLGGSTAFGGEFHETRWLRPVKIAIHNLGKSAFKIKEFTILDPKENERDLRSEMLSLQTYDQRLQLNGIEFDNQQLLLANKTLELKNKQNEITELNAQIEVKESEIRVLQLNSTSLEKDVQVEFDKQQSLLKLKIVELSNIENELNGVKARLEVKSVKLLENESELSKHQMLLGNKTLELENTQNALDNAYSQMHLLQVGFNQEQLLLKNQIRDIQNELNDVNTKMQLKDTELLKQQLLVQNKTLELVYKENELNNANAQIELKDSQLRIENLNPKTLDKDVKIEFDRQQLFLTQKTDELTNTQNKLNEVNTRMEFENEKALQNENALKKCHELVRNNTLEMRLLKMEFNKQKLLLENKTLELTSSEDVLNVVIAQLELKDTKLVENESELRKQQLLFANKTLELNNTEDVLSVVIAHLELKDTKLEQCESELRKQELLFVNKTLELNNTNAKMKLKNVKLFENESELRKQELLVKNKTLELNNTNALLKLKNSRLFEKESEFELSKSVLKSNENRWKIISFSIIGNLEFNFNFINWNALQK